MLDCFKNYIGVKPCDTTSVSKLFINDLEGINLEMASSVADSNYDSGVDLLKAKIDHALGLMQEDLRAYLMPFIRLDSVVDHQDVGFLKDAANFEGLMARKRGIRLKKFRGKISKLFINKVSVCADTIGTHQLLIKDGSTEVSFDFEVTASGEPVEVDVCYLANDCEVFIYIDNSAFNPCITKIKDAGCACKMKSYGNGNFNAIGWDGLKSSNNSYGITAQVNLECDESVIMCMLKNRLGYQALYRAGAEVMKEVQNSDRLNSFTICGFERAVELEQEWMQEYDKRMKVLAATLPNMLRGADKLCINCNGNRYAETI